MKPSIYRRIRRRTASHEAANANKESKQEQSFFGEASHETFFQPTPVVQRKCENCEEEDKKVQRQPEKKDEEKKVMRIQDKKEEDLPAVASAKEGKIQKKEEKKEEEKVMKKEEKKEDEKVMKKEEKKEEEQLQKKENGSTASGGKTASTYIGSINGKGNPLPANANQFFSSKMGYDFSNVKIHTDKEAAESAKDVNAKAYTIGNNIVFNEGQFNTESSEGKKLMAHELAHVMQQQSDSKKMLQRIACEETVTAPPRAAQGTRNTIDTRAQVIIDIAAGTASAATKAVSVVTQIICQYYPSDAAIVHSVVHNAALGGLDTTSVRAGGTTTGTIGVGDSFVAGTTAAHFARRVLQVGHEIQHIQQYRTGLAGANNASEREFLAFAENALADEFEGTGRMTNGTRLNIVDAAIGYYHCLTDTLKTQYQTRFAALQTRRQTILATGRVRSPGSEPTACVRSSN